LEPIYTLADAISDRHLVPYEYHAHAVRLTEEESERWSKLSKELNVLRARAKLGPGQGFADRAERLLMERARIAKKAHDKTALAVKVLREHFASGQRWLVYCEDREQLTDVVRSARGFIANVVEYYSSMNGDPEGTLRWFECHASVLVAINCLDEGIDIPSISHALILASSRNPRQFIQRRGRVLRRAPDKTRAVIHDVIVVPGEPCEASDQDGLLRSELRRALEFAASAANASARLQLRAIALAAGMDPDSIDDLGDEEEEGEGDEG
jgi:superfamily II DNA or RNA helicase